MNFQPAQSIPMAPKYLVGVAIRRTQGTGMHVGLVYTHSSGEVRFAHLAWHNNLLNDPAPNHQPYLWADCEWLADPAVASLAEFVTNFIEMSCRKKEIPYGHRAPARAFDAQGQYMSTDPQEGLTCATYISSVLKDGGFPVVDIGTWTTRPDDATWWANLEDALRGNPDTAARAAELSGISVDFRLRPDEIAVAAASNQVPLSFGQASAQAAPLNALLFPPPARVAALNLSSPAPAPTPPTPTP